MCVLGEAPRSSLSLLQSGTDPRGEGHSMCVCVCVCVCVCEGWASMGGTKGLCGGRRQSCCVESVCKVCMLSASAVLKGNKYFVSFFVNCCVLSPTCLKPTH